ncbi:outer membrane protein [Sphingomonas sp.]|uniref:outer membrane protein n=1 Tax=Sphingomonas sp. TaxID=28214 RepID=UPI0035BC204C
MESDGDSRQGVTYGLTLAYDITRKAMLLGLQVDLDASANRACETGLILAGDRACVAAKRDSAISLRLGRALTGSTVAYGTLGYANARVEARYRGGGIKESDHETLNGVRVGVGLSTDLSRKLFGKAEYRYTNYDQGVSRHQGLAGLGLRF